LTGDVTPLAVGAAKRVSIVGTLVVATVVAGRH
jgi:hypothetical protein